MFTWSTPRRLRSEIERLNRALHFDKSGIAIVAVFPQEPQNDIFDFPGKFRGHGAYLECRVLQNRRRHFKRARAEKGKVSGYHLVQHYSERKDIRALVEALSPKL